MSKKQYLVFARMINENSANIFTYEFYFTDDLEKVTVIDEWYEPNPLSVGDFIYPNKDNFSIKTVKTEIPLKFAQEQSCFSYRHCYDGCICVCFEDISEYEEYPTPIRLVFQYGEDFDSIVEKFKERNILFDNE